MKKQLHFKNEIRNAFLLYALVPVSVIIVLITLICFILWSLSINRQIKNDCRTIMEALESPVTSYAEKAAEPVSASFASFETGRKSISKVYSSLNEFVRKQNISANFIIVDEDCNILLQANSAGTFRIPDYQKNIGWGPLQRMARNSEKTVIEVSSDYSAGGLAEIVIGHAQAQSSSHKGFLLFTISAQDVQNTLKDIRSSYVITDTFGNVFTTTGNYWLDDFGKLDASYRTTAEHITITGDTAVFRADIADGALSIYTLTDISQTRSALIILTVLAVLLTVLLSAGMVVSAGKIARDKTASIDELVAAFHNVEEGNLENRIHIQDNIEFQTIGDAYNKMLDDIKRLIAENEKETKAKYISELKQLEMQFNPHFLYNTLATVRYLIKLDPDGAIRTIVSLSELLRYSIKTESSTVDLESDLMYIQNYLTILKTRFGKKFNFELTIPDNCIHAQIPKLMLQPVIENAVKYGFENVAGMKITVTARKAFGMLLLTLSDTGCGMSEEMLSQVNALLASPENASDHIGLSNVQRRVQLMYGPEYGITVSSTAITDIEENPDTTAEPEHGTTVVIKIPFQEAAK